MYNSKALGKIIAKNRIEKDLSQNDLGNMVGLSQGAISNLELGITEAFSLGKLSDIAEILDFRIDYALKDSLVRYSDKSICDDTAKSYYIVKISELVNAMSDQEFEKFSSIVSNFLEYKLNSIVKTEEE